MKPPALWTCHCTMVLVHVSGARISHQFVRGKRVVTADTALYFSKARGTSARLLINLQSTWDLSQAERRRSAA
jgi:plasmid maintenance system antidote protein VapI